MPNNRPKPGSRPQKGTGSPGSRAQGGAKSSTTSSKKSSSGTRYSERQARKEQALLEARRRRNQRYAIFTIAVVVVIIGVFVIVKVSGGGGGNGGAAQSSPPAGTPVPAATLAKISAVPVSTLYSAPQGGIITHVQAVNNPALTVNGKPELLFIGAEFCPHCAAERWAIYTALSKFGTFSPEPGRIHSAIDDGDVPTLTFYGTTYTSPYLTFTPVEVFTNKLNASGGYERLQTPTAAQIALWDASNGGGFPFLDLGGKHILESAQYLFTPLQGLPFSEVAAQVGNNSTQIGADIDASAGILIKTICTSMTHDQPASVCST
jgi:hypothetical protein